MNKKSYALSVLLLLFISTKGGAEEFKYNFVNFSNGTLHQGFGEGGTPNVARTVFSHADLSKGDEFMAQVGMTQRGLDIFIYTPEKCSKSDISEVNLNVSDQNVIFYKKCEYSGSSFIVKSEKGRDFLINKFKASQLVPIKLIDPKGRVISFNAFGFTKMWKNLGGNSL
ncbi:Probable cysteine desulfurase 2 [Moritella viscosa]|uniref:hypothetical protein n=1 Tax=Moritella viscosa TaxID=80854 RepID=UPI000910CD2B|nr:hypothetical protein [Moritella viscosa]SHO23793.1 Probable cysteine desulfurase 2 [Moritella viscosa]